MEKVCVKCNILKKDYRSGRNICKDCERERERNHKKEVYERDKNKLKTYQKEHRKNPLIREKQRARDEKRSKSLKRIEQQKLWREKNMWRLAANVQLRRARKLQRTPKWLTKEHINQMKEFYKNCPEGHEVDHVVPLMAIDPVTREHIASGLHLPWNLQYLTKRDNRVKKNKMEQLMNYNVESEV